MKVYFVRHGQSRDDVLSVHQRPDSPLSETGIRQAEKVAEHFHNSIPVDYIVSSPLLRARQTTSKIAEKLGKEVEYEDLVAEVKKPVELIGQQRSDPEFDTLRTMIKEKFAYPAWHYSTEENFHDVKRRALAFLSWVEVREDEHLVVVSHGHFLTMVFLVMVFRKLVTPEEYLHYDDFAHMDNTGITTCEYKVGKWKMLQWNDTLHLHDEIKT